jgi:hypothetical protein
MYQLTMEITMRKHSRFSHLDIMEKGLHEPGKWGLAWQALDHPSPSGAAINLGIEEVRNDLINEGFDMNNIKLKPRFEKI